MMRLHFQFSKLRSTESRSTDDDSHTQTNARTPARDQAADERHVLN